LKIGFLTIAFSLFSKISLRLMIAPAGRMKGIAHLANIFSRFLGFLTFFWISSFLEGFQAGSLALFFVCKRFL
jgi:hypothetical protein